MKRGAFTKRGALAIDPKAWGFEIEISEPSAEEPYREENGVAVVDICGPLTQHQEWFWDSYDAIKARVSKALESSCRAVVLNINSPGGDVAGCFDVARELRAMSAAAKKPLYAFADSMAASGGYALACAAQYVAVPETGCVGSIGVISTLFDMTASDAAAGLKFRIVTSGARKSDGHPHVPISEAAEAETQKHTDELAGLFFAWVADARGLSVDAIRGLEARVFFGNAAVEVGLADAVMTRSDLLALAASGKTNATPKAAAGKESKSMDYDQLKADLEADAAGDDEEKAAKAKKLLKALNDDSDGDGDKDKCPHCGHQFGKDSDKDKCPHCGHQFGKDSDKDKAEEEAKKAKKAEGDDADAKASAAVLERLGNVERENAALKARNEASDRAAIYAAENKARIDVGGESAKLTPGQIEFLNSLPLSKVKAALAAWPKPAPDPAAAAKVAATRGATDGETRTPRLPPTENKEMRVAMGLERPSVGVRQEGNRVIFPAMTPDDVRAATKARAAGGVK